MEPDNDKFVIGCGYTVLALMVALLVIIVVPFVLLMLP